MDLIVGRGYRGSSLFLLADFAPAIATNIVGLIEDVSWVSSSIGACILCRILSAQHVRDQRRVEHGSRGPVGVLLVPAARSSVITLLLIQTERIAVSAGDDIDGAPSRLRARDPGTRAGRGGSRRLHRRTARHSARATAGRVIIDSMPSVASDIGSITAL